MNNEEKEKGKHRRFVKQADHGRHETDHRRHEAEQGKTKVMLTSLARASREEAWHSRLMWPSPPHFQHRLSPLLSGRRRCRGSGLFVAAGMLSVSSSFSCRNTSAKSSPISLRVVTAASLQLSMCITLNYQFIMLVF
ncbi:hypothetical protein T05_5214 [Trichinella murrelli]|uniref:Uncharacterized protein n=1 Tax=Trichinella murrelli TaxID=144512 RepID=A0A0V0U9U6_9BILA|nr:hypothetical protein T05_5214 [Trichinella murrelli]